MLDLEAAGLGEGGQGRAPARGLSTAARASASPADPTGAGARARAHASVTDPGQARALKSGRAREHASVTDPGQARALKSGRARKHASVTDPGQARPLKTGRSREHALVTGRARPLLLLAVALAAGGAGLVLYLGRGGAAAPSAAPARPPSARPPAVEPEALPPASAVPPRIAAPSDAEVPPAAPADLRLGAGAKPDPDAARFEGERGRIRGYIETADATPFPARWTLVLEPSRTLTGRDRAEPRTLEFQAGEQEFTVSDLPLAGYDLCASAPGLNALRSPVLLDRKNRDPYVTLQFYPAGFVAGRVLTHEHLPADDLLVTLTDGVRKAAREVRTDVLGNFRFDGVLDGEYTLAFGPTLSPLLPVQTLRFSSPSLTVPDRELPALASLSILVLDEQDQPVAGATVRGDGPPGGALVVTTDARGTAVGRYLPPGTYKLSAEDELHGRVRLGIQLALPSGDAVLRFRSPR